MVKNQVSLSICRTFVLNVKRELKTLTTALLLGASVIMLSISIAFQSGLELVKFALWTISHGPIKRRSKATFSLFSIKCVCLILAIKCKLLLVRSFKVG